MFTITWLIFAFIVIPAIIGGLIYLLDWAAWHYPLWKIRWQRRRGR